MSASGWLNQQQAADRASGSGITQEQNNVASTITDLQVSISGISESDVVQAVTDLARENTSQSAAYAAQAQVPSKDFCITSAE